MYYGIMDRIDILACGKINLALDVVGLYGNGFHELDMCMATVDIGDLVRYERAGGITVTMNGEQAGNENSAYRALTLAVERGLISGGKVEIYKGLPLSSGMGGSSVDAAAVLYAIARDIGVSGVQEQISISSDALSNLDKGVGYERSEDGVATTVVLDKQDNRYIELANIGRLIGSDVVYLMCGGVARAHGKGDDIESLPSIDMRILVIMPDGAALTSRVFNHYDGMPTCNMHYAARVSAEIVSGGVITSIGNALTDAAIAINGNISVAIADMGKYTSLVAMTGSGSGVYGIFSSEQELERAYYALSCKYTFCRKANITRAAMIELKQSARNKPPLD